MNRKGFTLMELLVSIFITGMVMLSLVAMWRTSSNHTAQAQRQSIIRNESTMFLRKIYSDFISSSEIICPWPYSIGGVTCSDQGDYKYFVAVKEAVVDPEDSSKLAIITRKSCGSSQNSWVTGTTVSDISSRCIQPSYVAYAFNKSTKEVYRCSDNIPVSNQTPSIQIGKVKEFAKKCFNPNNPEREVIMPYVEDFKLEIKTSDGKKYPELLVDFTVNRDFGEGIPPVYFQFKHFLTMKRGV